MQTEKSQPEGYRDNAGNEVKQHYPLTRRFGFLSLHWIPMFDYFFLSYDIKNYKMSFVYAFTHEILRRITTFYERQSVFFVIAYNWRHFWNYEVLRNF